MEKITIKKNKPTRDQLRRVVDFLKKGKVIAYPTDTIYGLGCLSTKKEAIRRIYRMKKRPQKKPMIVLASDLEMVKKYCFLNAKQIEIIKKYRSNKGARPTTFLLKAKKAVPPYLVSRQKRITIRLPKSNFLVKIIKRAGAPVISTSLNISGKSNLENISGIEKYFGKACPDLAVDAGKMKNKPSMIIDITDTTQVRIIRK